MKSKITLSIIIPVYNNLNFTKNCVKNLDSVIQHANLEENTIKIIVVDDGSTDNTSDWIKKNYSRIELLKGDGNLWWSGAINVGMVHAFKNLKSEYVLWWNNDIEAHIDYFDNLFKLLEKNSHMNIIGSKILFKGEKRVWGMGGYFNPYTGKRGMYGMWKEDGPQYQRSITADWLPGMGTLLHFKVFTELGDLDYKNFPQYHGDGDYTYRAKLAGFSITVYPDLIIFNDKSNTGIYHDEKIKNLLKSFSSIKSNYNIKKDFIFYKKYAKSPLAYQNFIVKYSLYIGSFIKRKIFNIFGLKK